MSKKQPAQPRKRHSAEFKAQVVERALSGKQPKSQIARELGLSANLLHSWIAKHQKTRLLSDDTQELQAKLVESNRENARLREELAILKKAAAYFAKELR